MLWVRQCGRSLSHRSRWRLPFCLCRGSADRLEGPREAGPPRGSALSLARARYLPFRWSKVCLAPPLLSRHEGMQLPESKAAAVAALVYVCFGDANPSLPSRLPELFSLLLPTCPFHLGLEGGGAKFWPGVGTWRDPLR